MALIVAAIVAMIVARPSSAPPRAPPGTKTIVAVIGIAIVTWLALAPDPRFGAGPLWSLGALAAAVTGVSAFSFRAGWRVWIAPAIVLAAWVPRAGAMARLVSRPARNPGLSTIVGGGRIRIVSPIPTRAAFTTAGDTIWVPRDANEDRCALAPLPCAPTLLPNLVVVRRSDGTIAGFRTELPRS
jgi:hypothetical protein